MAGTAAESELSRSARARFAIATSDDDAAIRRLLRDHPMQGAIRLAFEREPNYFHGVGLAGAVDETIVAFSSGRLVCMGRCSRRDCWVDGRVTEVGYLAELRLDAGVRGQFAFVRGGYRFFREQQLPSPAKIYFTSIAADNHRARRLLERGARGMPEYRFLGELVTLLIAVPRRPRAAPLRLESAEPGDAPEIVRVLNESARRCQFAAVWTEERLLAREKSGLPLSRFLVTRERGRIVACGALWDQRSFRQTVVRGYSSTLAAIKPLVNLAARIFDTSSLPNVGRPLAHAFLSPLGFVGGAGSIMPDFVGSCFPSANMLGVRYLTLALSGDDLRIPLLRRRFGTRTYRTRLYRVSWPGDESPPHRFEGACFLPDVSLL